MAVKTKTVFLCSECGHDSAKWQGKCPLCGSWNTMQEFNETPAAKTKSMAAGVVSDVLPQKLSEITSDSELRVSTGISELDRVLGGGMVKGSLMLISGEPGIGKSTLILQACAQLGKTGAVLYVTGEESLPQIKLRAQRLDVNDDNLYIYSETQLNAILQAADRMRPQALVVDSIQTVFNPELQPAPGSVTQVRECTMTFMRYAKTNGIAVILVGHVNKDGEIAGPKVLEHMVDTVLSFEGDRHISYRILKAVKNRFGSTNEIGVFEMGDKGLSEVPNPSQALLSGRPESASGSCVAATIEGTRPILAEIQALVTKSGYGAARRTSSGLDYNRAVLLIAILEKRAGLLLSSFDAYINIVGGLTLDEPAADLPALLALASSYLDKPIASNVAAFGEVGLSGELRAVSGVEARLSELKRLGLQRCILPVGCKAGAKNVTGLDLVFVSDIKQAIKAATD